MQVSTISSHFKVDEVALEGSNIIEASAGTGKTYSIGILVIRLLLEKKISIQEILMVTFTKAAVAELEARVRAFVNDAENTSHGRDSSDPKIVSIVRAAIDRSSLQDVQDILRNARIFLDETAVFTIHGFCQRTLREFAFETGQIFGAEALSETESKEILEDALNHFWRKRVTTIEPILLSQLMKKRLSREILEKLVTETLSGKKFEATEILDNNFRKNNFPTDFVQAIQLNSLNQTSIYKDYLNYIENNPDEIRSVFNSTSSGRKNNIVALLERPLEFAVAFSDLWNKSGSPQYIQDMNALSAFLIELKELKKQADDLLIPWINKFFQYAIESICADIENEKKKRSRISFDDMIQTLFEAVTDPDRQDLVLSVRKKYKAVFIDEFQDTDRWQYEIFRCFFENHSILFYIGDPKQSIYGWRKADIFTYFRAVASVNSKFYMDTNFRSSASIIEAQNKFFLPVPDQDTFYFEQGTDRIEYQEVNSPIPNEKGELLYKMQPVTPITVFENANEEEVLNSVTASVIEMLKGEYTLPEKDNNRRHLRPSDFGILVRTNKQGAKLKEALSKFRIPAVTIDDTKLFVTDEALELLYVLEAVHDISLSHINRALITKFTGLGILDLKNLHEQKELNRFKSYQKAWREKGIYVMLRKFMADYKVRSVLMEKTAFNGDRILSNLLQLMELLHKIQSRNELAPAELIQWLKKGIDGAKLEGEEYEQRVESDEEAVKIVTIHKSKGLEYNIVMIPFMNNSQSVNKREFSTYRNNSDGSYHFNFSDLVKNDPVLNSQLERAEEQENRRLLYVAITRARYKCFINSRKKNGPTLDAFLPVLKLMPVQNLVEFAPVLPALDYSFRFSTEKKLLTPVYAHAKNFRLSNLNWRKLSYTGLSPDHQIQPKLITESIGSEYENFVFKELKKGAFTGNLLHYIFERIDFKNDEKWEQIVKSALKRLGTIDDAEFSSKLVDMLREVMHVSLFDGEKTFTLSQIGSSNKMTEMEFDFLLHPFNSQKLAALSSEGTVFSVKPSDELEGIMNGKVDLIFRFEEKFYILDWKSNHLGNDLNCYGEVGLAAAMEENNYHLQYHIYTDALDRYLKLRLPGYDYDLHFGGVFYLFLRGIRKKASSGIFFRKPDKNLIRQFPW